MNVISDINIICIEEKTKKEYIHDFIKVISKKNPYCYYSNEWEILSSIRGNWYQIVPECRRLGVYSKEFFDIYTNKNMCYVVLEKEYINIDFIKNMLLFYLNNSPINKIVFLIRLNYQKKRRIKGIIKLHEFLNKISNNQILFDTAYIIEM
jgi:hypothetical protein